LFARGAAGRFCGFGPPARRPGSPPPTRFPNPDMSLRDVTARMRIMGEMLEFFWQRRLWWLIPMIVLLLLSAVLLVLAQGSALGPFIYSIL
jgi:hypothetical protein